MLYLMDLNVFTLKNIVLCSVVVILILVSILLNNYVKKHNYRNISSQFIVMSICLFVTIVFGITSIFCIGRQIYASYNYRTNNYEVAVGEIKDFEYIYANNSDIAIGIRFAINDTRFEINKGVFDIGYTVENNIIYCNGQKLKIYYLAQDGTEFINTIIRIDEIEE